MKITKKWIFIGLGLAFIVLSLGIYKTFKAVSEFYPAQIRNSQFHRIVIGMAKDEVLKILTDIPNASNSAQFPQANLKCQTNGIGFEGLPEPKKGRTKDHFIVFFDDNGFVCDTYRF